MMNRINPNFVKGVFLLIILNLLFFDLLGQTDASNPLPQFLFPVFTKSIVKMKDGRTLTATMNYNMVDEEMIFEQRGVYMALEKPQDVDTVFLQNRKFVPVEKAFYEVLVKSKVILFIQHKSRYTLAGTTTAYGMKSVTLGSTPVMTAQSGNQVRQIDVPDDVTVSPATVYWVMKDNEMHKFNNEKQFLKIFPENEEKLKEYIKSNKLDIKSREDLIKLGDLCNELIK